MYYVAQIADSMGLDNYHFANMFYPGRAIPAHASAALNDIADYDYEVYTANGMIVAEDVSIKDALDEEKWDIVLFQTSPTGAASADGYKDLDVLIDYIKGSEGMDVQFMWQNSWTYANHDFSDTFTNYNQTKLTGDCMLFVDENGDYSQQAMQNAINDTLVSELVEGDYAEVIGKEGIIPVGLAIQLARESDVDFKLDQENADRFWDMTRDGYHLSYFMGRYIAALTIIRQLEGTDLVYTDSIYKTLKPFSVTLVPTEEQLRAAIDVVNAAFVTRDALAN